MNRYIEHDLTVPSTVFLQSDDTEKLACETKSWYHLKCYAEYIDQYAQLIQKDKKTSALSVALQEIRLRLGSPRSSQTLLSGQPNIATRKKPPHEIYLHIIWWIEYTKISIGKLISTLQQLQDNARQPKVIIESLQDLGEISADARMPIAKLRQELIEFKTLAVANTAVIYNDFKLKSASLQKSQEEIGVFNAQINNLKETIEQCSIIQLYRKKILTTELNELNDKIYHKEKASEKLRKEIKKLEPIIEESHWVEIGINDLIKHLEVMRETWTTYGSDIGQLVSDYSAKKTHDLEKMMTILNPVEATKKWQTIHQAASNFVSKAIRTTD